MQSLRATVLMPNMRLFLMSNIVPQAPWLNREAWRDLEMLVAGAIFLAEIDDSLEAEIARHLW
jgi:RecB family exonuclease